MTTVGGSAVGAVLFQACGIPEEELFVQAPIEMPEDLVTGLDNWYATLCRQCTASDGIVVRIMEGRAKKIEGNVDYPTNRGKHSARCEAGLQALYHPDRIKAPMLRVGERGSGSFREISWTDAMGRLAHQLRLRQEAGSQASVVMATDPVGSHLGLVVERFMSSYGGRHMAYEPLERTNLQAAIKQVFGQDVLPDFDIDNASTVLSFGADFLNTWVSPVRYGRGYGAFRQGDRDRGTLIHVDSRFSMTGANADEWVYVKPGMEGMLALSIAQVIISEDLGDRAAASALTGNGAFDIDAFAPVRVADKVGVSAEKITHVAHEFAERRPALAIGGGNAGAHTNGLFNLIAIYSLNYLVGSVNQEGGIVFNPEPPMRDVPVAPKVSSFAEWSDLTQSMKQGQVQVLMVRGADPWHGLPDGVGFKDATFDVPFLFSFSGFMDDMTSMTDLILPEHNYLEDWGSDIPSPGPGYETVGFQQPVVRPFFGERGNLGTQGFADVLLKIAEALQLDLGLPGNTFKDVLQDGARQLFDKGKGSVTAASFASFWNGALQRGGWWDTTARASSGVPTAPRLPELEEPRFDSGRFHLIPFETTGIGDGRGASLPWMQATPDPISTATWRTWVEINRSVAKDMGISEGDVITISTPRGSVDVLAYPHPGVPTDVIGVPVGQGHRASGRYAEGRGANIYSILTPSKDARSGALAWASTRAEIHRTGEWVRLPKFENTLSDTVEDEDGVIIRLTPIDS